MQLLLIRVLEEKTRREEFQIRKRDELWGENNFESNPNSNAFRSV
jgi:hypothetical protein